MPRSSSSGLSQRQLRVGEQVRHVLSDVLQRGDITDPVLETSVLSVSEVRMSPDLKIATCFIAPIGATDGDAIIEALSTHAKFIRGRVASGLRQMKYMPQFRFRIDTSFDNFSRIDALLRSPEVARDLPNPRDDDDGEDGDADGAPGSDAGDGGNE
ncbi:30S ribosome-binding factor RbfA [Phyllobacterium salinisoli]|uniref:Ribosome-binding factor A n=1 Tax=Phyllobacterium salinisoli TaxID=1899321 RepID=A0A368KAC7_9HYPH|nr:30S ribosome-binding factor RbfA [Phyllobacterium salinisoli]RCS25040.1 30S ribosome-binding factor RbfA [Phyllobacterium salinisoli]